MAKKIQLTKNGEDVYPITVPDSIAGLAQVAKTGSYNDLSDIPLPSPPEVFLITRDVTTYAEIYAAVNAGKVCMMYNYDEVYTVTCCENGEPIHLYTYGKNGISGVEISPEDEWEWVDYYYTDFVIFHAKIGRSTLYQIFYAVNARMLVLGRATEDATGDELYSLVAISYGNQGYALFSRTDEDGMVYFAKVTKSGNQESWSYSDRFIASYLSDLSDDSTHRLVTDTEKSTWNGKYTKPAGGIPASDIADDVALLDESSSLLVPLEVERTANKVQSITGNESSTEKYPSIKAMADALGKMGVIRQTQTWTRAADGGYDYTMSNPVRGLIPKANIDLFERAGAVFNASSGYFELNGLTDISYEEMQDIYNAGKMIPPMGMSNAYFFSGSPIRTTIPFITRSSNGSLGRYNISGMFRNTNIEVLHLAEIYESDTGIAATTNYGFEASRFIKTITDVLSLPGSGTQNHTAIFLNCRSLESIRIKGLAADISVDKSPRLTAESVAYMISNSASATITITLHATAYARATADPAVQAALANHTNVTLASA